MIAPDSIITYVGTWHGTFTQSADKVVNAVSAKLVEIGLVTRTSSFDAGFWSTFTGPFSVTLSLQVANGLGFTKTDDIVALIRHAVLGVTGEYPSSDSIPYVQVQGGDKVPTGQPGTPAGNAPKGCLAGTGNDALGNFSVSCWFSNLTTKGLSTVGALVLVGLAAVGLILFYGPQPRHQS